MLSCIHIHCTLVQSHEAFIYALSSHHDRRIKNRSVVRSFYRDDDEKMRLALGLWWGRFRTWAAMKHVTQQKMEHLGWGLVKLPTAISTTLHTTLLYQTESHSDTDLHLATFMFCVYAGVGWYNAPTLLQLTPHHMWSGHPTFTLQRHSDTT